MKNDRPAPSLRECFAFPLASPEARRDVLIGGTLLFLPLVGWVFNLGHRLEVVRRVYHHDPPYFRGFAPWGLTLQRGAKAFTAIAVYLSPAAITAGASALAWRAGEQALGAGAGLVAFACFALGVFSLPGGMTYNAATGDIRYLYRPDEAFRRALEGGKAYLIAWGIAFAAIALSFVGLAALGVGFFYTSVWAWSVVGYAFSKALALSTPAPPAP